MQKLLKSENLLCLNMKHYIGIFNKIISAIQDPNNKTSQTLTNVIKLE